MIKTLTQACLLGVLTAQQDLGLGDAEIEDPDMMNLDDVGIGIPRDMGNGVTLTPTLEINKEAMEKKKKEEGNQWEHGKCPPMDKVKSKVAGSINL